ncbi:MAG TPA: mechanosensitive ion channel domain-containing protein [Terriglobales bacterium]|nr:mechanosensitive ion channel domain-containing protein [Terriglobales bacterium]
MAIFLAAGPGVANSQTSAATTPDPQEIIQFLSQTINWYRQLTAESQIAKEPSDAIVVNDNRQIANQVVRLAFDFGRAQADALAKQANSKEGQSQNPGLARYQALLQLSAKLDNQIRDTQAELERLREKLDTANGRNRKSLQSAIAEVQSELDLANARRDALRSMVEFVSGASTSGLGATGLRAQIEAMARALPPELTQTLGKEENNSASHQLTTSSVGGNSPPGPSGIWGLTGDLFEFSGKIHVIDQTIGMTDELSGTAKQLRAPLINKLKELSQQGDQLANQPDSNDPNILAQQKKQLDALTAQFKPVSQAVLPLSKLGILLDLYKRSLNNWRGAVRIEYRAALRGLLLRLAILAGVLIVVVVGAELWRKTIFRYVHDPRRRYQFLLLRKIVLWFVICIVIAFAFASQLGSVATFAGLLTAGVAVALQNVILSIAGYFFLIGRFGLRVGDRVQVAGVTGEVVDIGLVRFHLMELSSTGAGSPTGRVVAFSNSLVFQPASGLFKQIPGTNFVWHEITLTLSPDSDYQVAEERLLGVVEAVFADYREEMERQRRQMERTLAGTPVSELRPRSRLRLTQVGLEAVIGFPVDLQRAAEIDDRVTRELLKAIDREPKLKLAGSGTPSIRLRTDLTPSNAATS